MFRFKEHFKNVVYNLIANLVIVAGGGLISLYTAHQAVIAGVPRYVAVLIGVGVFAVLAVAVAAIAWAVSRFWTPNKSRPAGTAPQPQGPPVFEDVVSRTFVNEIVDIDGKSYRNCTFRNVTFQFNGGEGQIMDCVFQGPPQHIRTENPAVMGTVAILKGLGFLDPNFALQAGPYRHPLTVHAPTRAEEENRLDRRGESGGLPPCES